MMGNKPGNEGDYFRTLLNNNAINFGQRAGITLYAGPCAHWRTQSPMPLEHVQIKRSCRIKFNRIFVVSLSDKTSNTLLQTLDSLSALYQLIIGKFSF